MTTINKNDRPQILTESDRILSDLQNELGDLKNRMHQLEDEQEENRSLVEQLNFYEEFSKAAQDSLENEKEYHKENYQVVSNVMQNLKSPVTDMVHNLADLLKGIEDPEVQGTLNDCIDTANTVLESFTEVSDFCDKEAKPAEAEHSMTNMREFLKNTLLQIQQKHKLTSKVRLMADQNIPEETPIFAATLSSALEDLIMELDKANAGEIVVQIKQVKNEEKYSIEIADLVLTIETARPTNLSWGDSWVEAIKDNLDNLRNKGFGLLNTRDHLRHTGGSLEVIQKEGKLAGFQCHFPLTY